MSDRKIYYSAPGRQTIVTERQNDSMAVAGQLKSPLLFLVKCNLPLALLLVKEMLKITSGSKFNIFHGLGVG